MSGKYLPLSEALGSAAHNGRAAVRMDFAELARLVGGLPTSAYTRRGWWANGYLVQAKSWVDAGWRVRGVDLEQEWVLFAREGEPDGRGVPGPSAGRAPGPSDGSRPAPSQPTGPRPTTVT